MNFVKNYENLAKACYDASEIFKNFAEASLTYVVSAAQKTVTIGSNLAYSAYVELGTGIFAEKDNGRKTPWVWQDFNGKWHFTRGMKPRPFLRPAVEDHIKELQEIAVEEGNK